MIKLVCFDVDNTLLKKGEHDVSVDTLRMIKSLTERGILVAVVSGRPFCDLVRLFKDVIDDVIIVSYDGSFAVYKNSVIINRHIDKDLLLSFVDIVKSKGIFEYAAYGIGCVYVNSKSGSSSVSMEKAGTMEQRIVYVPDFHQVEEPIYKLSAFIDVEKHDVDFSVKNEKKYDYEFFISDWSSYLKNIYTGNGWCEFVSRDNDKGNALRLLCEKFSVDAGEVMAFGDGENDIGMLEFAGCSFAVNAASEDVLNAAKYATSDVLKTVKRFFEI